MSDKIDDPSSRMHRASDLIESGRFQEALNEYLWCFDHGLEHGPGFYGVRLSFLLGYISDLGKTYPAALNALKARRDRLEERLLAGTAVPQEAHDYAAINSTLDDNRRTLEIHDRLGNQRLELGEMMFGGIFNLLLEARRYPDILAASGSITQQIDNALESFQHIKDFVEGKVEVPMDPSIDPALAREMIAAEGAGLLANQRNEVIATGAKFYEALLGTGRTDEAAALVDRLVGFHPSSETLARIMRHAFRAGRPDLVPELVSRGKSVLPLEEHTAIDEAFTAEPEE